MTKEIYEKKHLFAAVIDAAVFLVVLVCTVLMMILLPTVKNSAFESEWAHIALIVGFEFMGLIILILAPFDLWARYSRYIDLCMARRPAVIIGDDELKFYSSTDEYKCYRWDEIRSFKLNHSRKYCSIYLEFKESWRKPKWYVWLFTHYANTIRTDHLEIAEDDLLNELNSHLKK